MVVRYGSHCCESVDHKAEEKEEQGAFGGKTGNATFRKCLSRTGADAAKGTTKDEEDVLIKRVACIMLIGHFQRIWRHQHNDNLSLDFILNVNENREKMKVRKGAEHNTRTMLTSAARRETGQRERLLLYVCLRARAGTNRPLWCDANGPHVHEATSCARCTSLVDTERCAGTPDEADDAFPPR